MRTVTLSAVQAGMTRLRDKGGASPETLYELTNGYVDASRAPTVRPGTVLDYTIPVGTKGLCPFGGKLHVFAAGPVTVLNPLYVVNILRHPDATYVGGIFKIHFAKPFLGFLYVVAEFDDGSVHHYWLQNKGTWLANHQYMPGDVVSPTVPNGFMYKASPVVNPIAWAPNVRRNLGDVVQPTTANGWKYTVIEAAGDNPSSGSTEPTWPTSDGVTVSEDVDTSAAAAPPSDGSSGSPGGDRYD